VKIAGHALYFAGAPYRRSNGKWLRWNKDGGGHGMCYCGAVSDFELSNRARKRWHEEHTLLEAGERTETWSPTRVKAALQNEISGPIDAKVTPDKKQGRVMVTIAWGDLLRLVDAAVQDWPLDNPDVCGALTRHLERAEQLAGITMALDPSNVSGRA